MGVKPDSHVFMLIPFPYPYHCDFWMTQKALLFLKQKSKLCYEPILGSKVITMNKNLRYVPY